VNGTLDRLRLAHCTPVSGEAPRLSDEQIAARLALLPDWSLEDAGISKTFQFRDYLETIAFVNAAAWLSHREDHHPDLHVMYKACKVTYRTHSIDSVSENDFICAAKLDALLEA
jgi:4a-hydroxytetrahydrobiopterin dehydratase